jgi:hypothetical protein
VFFDPPGSVQQLIYGLMVCFLIFGANAYFKPYVADGDETLAVLCQAQIFFALLASVVNLFEGLTLREDYDMREDYNMGTLLIVFTVIPAAIGLYMETLRDEFKECMKKQESAAMLDQVARKWLPKGIPKPEEKNQLPNGNTFYSDTECDSCSGEVLNVLAFIEMLSDVV